MDTRRIVVLALTAALIAPAWSAAQSGPGLDDYPGLGGLGGLLGPQPSIAAGKLKVHAVVSDTRVAPGGQFRVAIVCDLADGWVYYSPDPGPIVIGGGLDVQAEDMKLREVRWPADHQKATDYGDGPIVNNVYKHRFVIYAELAAPADAKPGERPITLTLQGQICLDVCVNLEGANTISASTTVRVAHAPVVNDKWTSDLQAGWDAGLSVPQLKARHAAEATTRPAGEGGGMAPAVGTAASAVAGYGIWAGLGLAILAGLTLNIMPCVLPIIPLRIYSLVNMAGQSRKRFVTLGLAFAAGIVLFFVGLAAVSAGLRLLGKGTIDLNEQFQYSWARILIAMILLALSANLWGLFNVTVPNKVAGLGQDAASHRSHASAVGMGLMMAVLSTPCSFWLMALALAWAQIQPLWLGTASIVLIGIGMALPHAVLASVPRLVKLLPKPGQWMEYFKQTMGFLLVPAVLLLLSTLPPEGGWPWFVGAFGLVLVFALWVWGSWVRYDAPLKRKLLVRGFAVVLAVGSGLWLLPQPVWKGVEFQPLDPDAIAQAREQGRVVVVDVTARWCLECKKLDADVFSRPEIANAFKIRNVLPMQANVTEKSSRDSKWVATNIGGAPPMTIIYPAAGGKPRVVVGVYGPEDMIRYLDEAKKK